MIQEQRILLKIEEHKTAIHSLECEKERVRAEEMQRVFKSAKGMDKSLFLLKREFVSSCGTTPEYLQFHRTFKREIKAILKPYCEKVEIGKPNHFDLTGFIQLKDNRIYYISVGDIRWSKENMLIRTAESFKDYTGGSNNAIGLDKDFIDNLLRFLRVGGKNE